MPISISNPGSGGGGATGGSTAATQLRRVKSTDIGAINTGATSSMVNLTGFTNTAIIRSVSFACDADTDIRVVFYETDTVPTGEDDTDVIGYTDVVNPWQDANSSSYVGSTEVEIPYYDRDSTNELHFTVMNIGTVNNAGAIYVTVIAEDI